MQPFLRIMEPRALLPQQLYSTLLAGAVIGGKECISDENRHVTHSRRQQQGRFNNFTVPGNGLQQALTVDSLALMGR